MLTAIRFQSLIMCPPRPAECACEAGHPRPPCCQVRHCQHPERHRRQDAPLLQGLLHHPPRPQLAVGVHPVRRRVLLQVRNCLIMMERSVLTAWTFFQLVPVRLPVVPDLPAARRLRGGEPPGQLLPHPLRADHQRLHLLLPLLHRDAAHHRIRNKASRASVRLFPYQFGGVSPPSLPPYSGTSTMRRWDGGGKRDIG